MNFHSPGEGIWEHSQYVTFWGASLPHRMTIVRLDEDCLLVHSPTRCDAETKRALNDLGQVAHVVAPNGMHDLFLREYAAEFPRAQFWIPPGVDRYFPGLKAEHLPGNSQQAWDDKLECVMVEGMPRLNECVFYHARSKSLIVADLFFNIPEDSPALIKLAARIGGFYKRLATPTDIRWFLVRNKDAFRKSMEKLRSFPFENIIVGHGTNVIGGGRIAFDRAVAWIER